MLKTKCHLRALHSCKRMHTLDEHCVLQVMMQTARFVRESGGHSELVLRVRQASNPNFTFLRPDDPRHPYFQWLVSADPQVTSP